MPLRPSFRLIVPFVLSVAWLSCVVPVAQAAGGKVPLLHGLGTAFIDGTMSDEEWAQAACLSLVVRVPNQGLDDRRRSTTVDGMFCVMNDADNLYMSLRFTQPAADAGKSFTVEFDNNGDGVAANGDDAIVYNASSKVFFDDFRTNVRPCPYAEIAACAPGDIDDGGTTDGAGAFTSDGTYWTYEMSHPLDSGDSGHDFALVPGSRIGFFLHNRILSPSNEVADTFFPGFRDYGRICIRKNGGSGAECLASSFLTGHPCVAAIVAGMPYDMDDPQWLVNISDLNKNVCAYKFFAAFHMLGYNTQRVGPSSTTSHLQVLHAFQAKYGLAVNDLVTPEVLVALDALLVQREAQIDALAKTFSLYDHMQPLHSNDVSRDWVAYIYTLPMRVLPTYLHMSIYETVQCIYIQCMGAIQDGSGNDWPIYPVDVAQDYRFVGSYFSPVGFSERLPSAAVHVGGVLHEFAHYIDHYNGFEEPSQPLKGIINTHDFHAMSYDMTQYQAGCAPPLSNDPKQWVTKYGFDGYGCSPGTKYILEEWAEAFSMYVAAGKHFRAAAQQNATIAQKYNWLKTNVFQGIEYDTDLQRGVESGCNDVPGYQMAEPHYASCSESYLWDGELRIK